MMRIKKILATLTLSMACFSGTTQDISKLRIDPSKAYGGTVSEYFSSIEYIPLETNKESLFGDISNMIITDSTFVILDQDTHSVLFFDSTGKYLTKISRSAGYIPAEIFYNKDDNQIIIASYNESRNVKGLLYTTRGEFIADLEASESLAKKISAIYLEGYQANLNNYNQLRNTENDSPFYFYSIYKNGAHHKSLIPYDPKKK